jgi:hypothetical protein
MPASKPNVVELGVSGLKHEGGIIREEFLRELKGQSGVKVYKEMSSNDPVVGAMMFAVEMIMRQASWRTEPGEETPQAQTKADFLDTVRTDMSASWEDTMAEILSMLDYGWSYFEVVYKLRQGPEQKDSKKRSQYSDGGVGWRKFAIRAQESLEKWELEDNGDIRGMWQTPASGNKSIFIPIEVALLFRTSVMKNNPEGKSVLRNGYRPWFFKKRIEELEGIGIERDLAGIPVGRAPVEYFAPNATPEQVAALEDAKRMVTNIRRDEQEGIMLPALYDAQGNPLWDIKLMTTGGRRSFDTDKIISRYDQRIAMSLLADFILLGHESVGSFALSQSKMDLFSQAINSYLDAIAAVINQHAVPKLLSFNNMLDDGPLPYITHGGVDEVDIVALGEYIQRVVGAGMPLFPDVDAERYIRERAGIPTTALTNRDNDEVPDDGQVDDEEETDADAVDDEESSGGSEELDDSGEA